MMHHPILFILLMLVGVVAASFLAMYCAVRLAHWFGGGGDFVDAPPLPVPDTTPPKAQGRAPEYHSLSLVTVNDFRVELCDRATFRRPEGAGPRVTHDRVLLVYAAGARATAIELASRRQVQHLIDVLNSEGLPLPG